MLQVRLHYDKTIGPLIDGAIGYPVQLLQPGSVAPKSPTRFLTDTGSSRTFIHPSLVSALSLQWVARQAVWGMTGPADVDIYVGDVDLDGLGSFAGIQLYEMPKPSPVARYTAILGRDILDGGAVLLDGRTKELVITF